MTHREAERAHPASHAPRVRRAIVAGGGVAGPVAAMFLRRLGVDVAIHEARPGAATDEGAFLGVAPNGMNVLAELGVADAVAAVGVACEGFAFANARGEAIGAIDRRDDERAFGARLVMVRRSDLHRVLLDAAAARGVEVTFGRRLVDLDRTDPARVVARFDDGAADEGDVLLGCDGVRSRVRDLVFPGGPAPADSGLLDFGGFAPCPAGAPIEPGWNTMVFGRRAFFGAFVTPEGEVWWFHNSRAADAPSLAMRPDERRAHVARLHEGDPAWIAEVVRATDHVLGPWPLHDLLALPRWHDGRVCLLGDAAHATTPSAGQGASLAIEDGLALARCLRDVDDPAAAFAAFQRSRQARVDEVIRIARRNGDNKAVASPIACWFRDRMLPFFLRLGAKDQARGYAYRMDWDARAA